MYRCTWYDIISQERSYKIISMGEKRALANKYSKKEKKKKTDIENKESDRNVI